MSIDNKYQQMRKIIVFIVGVLCVINVLAQKAPLNHSVYDGWQAIGKKILSNNGKWVVYAILPQEGDQELVVQSTDARYKRTIARGDSATITEDSRFLIFHIKPLFAETRQARIKRKRGDDLPKDSLGIIELGRDSILKIPRIKGYKTPEKSFGWVACHLEKSPGTPHPTVITKSVADSLIRIIDSLQQVIERIPRKEPTGRDAGDEQTITSEYWDEFAGDDDSTALPAESGTDLILKSLGGREQVLFKNVLEYSFSANGQRLLIEVAKDPFIAASKPAVILYDLKKGIADTLSKGGNDFKSFALSDDGTQAAYLAERDAGPKELQRFYKLWYFKEGMDSAIMLVDRNSPGMQIGMAVSKFFTPEFSKNGERLFFGTAPIPPVSDTTLAEIDKVRLDIWHYNDDHLQTVQLNRLRRNPEENYLAVYHLASAKMVQLGSREIPLVIRTGEGNGDQFVGVTDLGKRIEGQWEGATKKDIYALDVNTGLQKLVKKDLEGVVSATYQSPTGKYILWYDAGLKNYFTWDGVTTRNITSNIKVSLCDEDHDMPSHAPPYGVMGWYENDSVVFIYDRYDVWVLRPDGKGDPATISRGFGRTRDLSFRYISMDSTKKYFSKGDGLYFRSFNNNTKARGIWYFTIDGFRYASIIPETEYAVASFSAPRSGQMPIDIIFTRENFTKPADLYAATLIADTSFHDLTGGAALTLVNENRLSTINAQQSKFNWGTAELFKWRAYNGKESEGIVYKPEDFDPRKKYPTICYFYERLTDGLYHYTAPEPTRSRLNIPFFVSRGYIVFAPDIHYSTAQPGKDAYDHVVSGVRALARKGFVDTTKMGLQGQSWGGYQVAYIITATNLFKAAWAGAPVANMTSAYGGIRWESGLNRQFQYEKTQSRIGSTLWENLDLYIENSPLFRLQPVKTPLVIMANDADGAVPWYQGIELFTGMRRLGKKVWLLNYNGEAHNLVERKNKKDLQIRQQQFFDWLLKDEPPARWIKDGIPAVNKGIDWGLD
jgi:dipeptidyl aminopeptidase/acylaminoacyl peptidase